MKIFLKTHYMVVGVWEKWEEFPCTDDSFKEERLPICAQKFLPPSSHRSPTSSHTPIHKNTPVGGSLTPISCVYRKANSIKTAIYSQ